jgi:hypothetical protein
MSEPRADYNVDEEQQIIDPSDLRKYRIELPNLYDDSDLDVYEFRLLAHYKRVGRCTEGSKTTGKKCKMSPAQVSEKRKSLRDKGFISMQEIPLEDSRYSYIITVVDRWLENFNKYSTPSPREAPPSQSEARPHVVKQRKNQLKKEPRKKKEATPPPPEVALFHDLTGRYPAKPSFETVVQSVQEIKARLGREVTTDDLKPFLTAWTDKAWNPLNLAWLTEWAVSGQIPSYQKGANYANRTPTPANGSQPATPDPALIERINAQRAARRPNV